MQSRQCAEHPSPPETQCCARGVGRRDPRQPEAVRVTELSGKLRGMCSCLSGRWNTIGVGTPFNTSETLFSCCLLPILIILQTLVHSSNEDKRVNRMLCRPAPCHKHLLSPCLYKIQGAEEARTAWASLEILFTNRYCESKSLKMF